MLKSDCISLRGVSANRGFTVHRATRFAHLSSGRVSASMVEWVCLRTYKTSKSGTGHVEGCGGILKLSSPLFINNSITRSNI